LCASDRHGVGGAISAGGGRRRATYRRLTLRTGAGVARVGMPGVKLRPMVRMGAERKCRAGMHDRLHASLPGCNIAVMKYGASKRRSGRQVFRCAVFFLAGFLMAALAAQAQEPVPPPDTLPADSTHVDSIAAADTLAAAASTVSGTDSSTLPAARAVIRDIGAPLGALVPLEDGAGYDLLTKRALVWERYYTAFDALAPLLPAYPLSQGGPGLVRTFSYAGASPESISGLFNGRPFGGPGGR